MRPLTVDRGKVDRLGATTHDSGHLLQRNIEDQRRGLAMDVTTGLECLNERRIFGQVGQQPQLDLRVIRRNQLPTPARYEPATNVASQLAANRNVLKIWIT